ncbi:hypothetical protein GK1001 [Geobacillus kaustophilus HTA426]|uniref:Uncharacterized protein n=1 Tax=Geobacillus kaustophilus (strain HTA426) TaxID=235909 RepID=Q5L194_GEOKA|nr:hypothetical protein GK1001 [Geobacillus kaustophilus HTA426]
MAKSYSSIPKYCFALIVVWYKRTGFFFNSSLRPSSSNDGFIISEMFASNDETITLLSFILSRSRQSTSLPSTLK